LHESVAATLLGHSKRHEPRLIAQHTPPPAPFRKVSELVKLPDFLPGIGTLYVDPTTLPEGPFLAYDHSGRLDRTIYMVPLKDLNEHKKLEGLGAGDAKVWHVSKADEADVAK
jgi:hypothetical protein